MKLSKTLLSALLTGITMQTVVSCEKEVVDTPKQTSEQNVKAAAEQPVNLPECCPACGRG